jgi:hypothetical protein
MQPFLLVKLASRPVVRLSLGILADRNEHWQYKARQLQVRRWKKLERSKAKCSHGPFPRPADVA